MNPELKKLDDQTLLSTTRDLVQKERETTTLIIHHLREIERRKLFAALGYASLFDYCVRQLGYSEASAQRRISSMRLLKELPQIEEKFKNGSLSLSVVAQAQSFFKQEAKANQRFGTEEKLALVQSLEGKSAREAERHLLSLSSQPSAAAERIRPVDESQTELKLVVDQEIFNDLEKLKGLLAHSHPGLSYTELVALLAKMALEKLDPAQQASRRSPLPTSEAKRHIPAALKREVFRRDGGRCVYRSAATGATCGSQYALEIDHIKPFARGGTNTADNLRLVCRNHNQRLAIVSYGLTKLEGARTRIIEYCRVPPPSRR